jgi:HSP20 family protein
MTQFSRDWFSRVNMMQNEMNQLLDYFAGSKPPTVRFVASVWEPNIDLYETDEHLVLVIELAGVGESNVEISVDRDTFTIKGSRRKESEPAERRAYHRMEIASGPFGRTIRLPVAIDVEKVKATSENGLIEVVLPKAKSRGVQRLRVEGS